jgi:hypothetical protein
MEDEKVLVDTGGDDSPHEDGCASARNHYQHIEHTWAVSFTLTLTLNPQHQNPSPAIPIASAHAKPQTPSQTPTPAILKKRKSQKVQPTFVAQ